MRVINAGWPTKCGKQIQTAKADWVYMGVQVKDQMKSEIVDRSGTVYWPMPMVMGNVQGKTVGLRMVGG